MDIINKFSEGKLGAIPSVELKSKYEKIKKNFEEKKELKEIKERGIDDNPNRIVVDVLNRNSFLSNKFRYSCKETFVREDNCYFVYFENNNFHCKKALKAARKVKKSVKTVKKDNFENFLNDVQTENASDDERSLAQKILKILEIPDENINANFEKIQTSLLELVEGKNEKELGLLYLSFYVLATKYRTEKKYISANHPAVYCGETDLAKDEEDDLAKDGETDLANDEKSDLAKDREDDLAKDEEDDLAKDGETNLAKDEEDSEITKKGSKNSKTFREYSHIDNIKRKKDPCLNHGHRSRSQLAMTFYFRICENRKLEESKLIYKLMANESKFGAYCVNGKIYGGFSKGDSEKGGKKSGESRWEIALKNLINGRFRSKKICFSQYQKGINSKYVFESIQYGFESELHECCCFILQKKIEAHRKFTRVEKPESDPQIKFVKKNDTDSYKEFVEKLIKSHWSKEKILRKKKGKKKARNKKKVEKNGKDFIRYLVVPEEDVKKYFKILNEESITIGKFAKEVDVFLTRNEKKGFLKKNKEFLESLDDQSNMYDIIGKYNETIQNKTLSISKSDEIKKKMKITVEDDFDLKN